MSDPGDNYTACSLIRNIPKEPRGILLIHTGGGGGATRMRDGVNARKCKEHFFISVPNPEPKFLGVLDPEKTLISSVL